MKFCGECGHQLPLMTDTLPRKCSNCGWEWWDPPVPVVIAMVRNQNGEIVYTRNHNFPAGAWGLISGFVEHGETTEEATIREVEEETGLRVRLVRYIGSFVGSVENPQNVYVSYLCEPAGGHQGFGTTKHWSARLAYVLMGQTKVRRLDIGLDKRTKVTVL